VDFYSCCWEVYNALGEQILTGLVHWKYQTASFYGYSNISIIKPAQLTLRGENLPEG